MSLDEPDLASKLIATYDEDTLRERIPDELIGRPQWVCWKEETRNGNLTKIPKQPDGSGKNAKSNDMATWGSFTTALNTAREREWGIGFVFSDAGPYAGIDLDAAYADGRALDWVPDTTDFIGTYSDVSPSRTGLHILLKDAHIPEWWSNWKDDETGREVAIFDSGRFFTMTGIGEGSDVVREIDDDVLNEFLLDAYELHHGEPPAPRSTTPDTGTSSADIDLRIGDIISTASHPRGERVEHPYHGSSTGSNFMVNTDGETFTCWSSGCSGGNASATVGNVHHLIAMEVGKLECGEWYDRDIGSEEWREIYDEARACGYDIPEPKRSRPSNDPDPQPIDDSDILALEPSSIRAVGGVGEDGKVSDLNDREKAACVWNLVQQSPDHHVRVRRDNGSLWGYDSGVWTPDGGRTLRHGARQALGPMNYGQNVLAELKAQARSDPTAEVESDDLGGKTGFIATENGFVDLDAAAAGVDAVRDIRPEDYALARLPVEFDPDAPYDEWHSLVEEWAEDGLADALQEYVGYCLHLGAMPIHRALLLVGSGANGKGTFLSVVRTLLGRENATSIELQTLANEKDAAADFYGSIANIDDDLSARKLGAGLGMFKKLTAGDRVRARRLYEDGFEYDATGKHLYAANEVPQVDVPDDDEAFWRRWLLVEFPNHYPPNERDPQLRDRLTEPESLSGVLNWAIEGRRRLLDQGHFTNEERYGYEKRERWQAWGESVDKFISECIDHDPDAPRITTGDAHRRYAAWCRENNEDPVGQMELTNKLKTEDVGYKSSIRIDGKVERGYGALGFGDAVPALEDTPERRDPDDAQQDSLF